MPPIRAYVRFNPNIGAPIDGWIRFRFTGQGGEINVVAAYTPNDTFYDFVTAIQAVFESGGAYDVQVSEEPAFSLLRVERVGDKLVLTLRGETGEHSGRIEADFHTGCRQIALNLHRLMSDVGYDGFVQQWRHSPPRARINDLWARVSASAKPTHSNAPARRSADRAAAGSSRPCPCSRACSAHSASRSVARASCSPT